MIAFNDGASSKTVSVSFEARPPVRSRAFLQFSATRRLISLGRNLR